MPVELPISTIIMLRAIGDVARSEGEDMRDPKASNTRRDEMARTEAPYLHPKIGVTEFVAPPRLGDDNEIRIVFVDPQGRHVPFKPPPELEAAATGPNTPQQLDLNRSEEDRQLLTR